MSENAATTRALVEHVAGTFPGRELTLLPGTSHVRQEIPDFQVARLSPSLPGEPWVYVSLGAWEPTREQLLGHELVLLSPVETPRHVETLSTCGYYHSFYGLDAGSVMKVARGWLLDSLCDRLLVAPPRFAPALEWRSVGERRVRFLRLIPITQEEEKLARAQGGDALETRLTQVGVDLLDPRRASTL